MFRLDRGLGKSFGGTFLPVPWWLPNNETEQRGGPGIPPPDKNGLTEMTTAKRTILTVLAFVAGVLTNSTSTKAQDMSNGADNFYKSDKVAVEKVTFKNQYQMTIAGNLLIPKGPTRDGKYPGLVVGQPMVAVKEQSANLYAAKMAEPVFVALSL